MRNLFYGNNWKSSLNGTLIVGTALASVVAFAQPQAKPFRNESEAGMVLTSGNTEFESYNVRQKNTYEFGLNALRFNGQYIQAQNRDVDVMKYWDAALRYERKWTDYVGIFGGYGIESNKFSGIRRRYNTDAGVHVSLIRNDVFDLHTELGYRHIGEDRYVGGYRTSHNGRAFMEGVYDLTEKATLGVNAEYLYNFSENDEWRANGEAWISAAINDIFSVKTTYSVRYENKPILAKDTDTFWTTSLVARF